MKREFYLVFCMNSKPDIFLERVIRLFGNGYFFAISYFNSYFGRAVNQGCNTVIGSGIPEVLYKLGPALVHVGQAAGVTRSSAENER